jgi:tRNA G18 (ribose-2'-O)-methylase SpoU
VIRKLSHEEISSRRTPLKSVAAVRRIPVSVLLDNVRSLYNVGSIFRTSDAVLIEKLYLCGFTPHPPRREIEKTALGATQSVPWEYHKNAEDLVVYLKSKKVEICVLELTTDSVPYYGIKRENFPLCLIIGNELTGVSKELMERADLAIEIPMYGVKHSLNVAVAYGIAIFEINRIYRSASR